MRFKLALLAIVFGLAFRVAPAAEISPAEARCWPKEEATEGKWTAPLAQQVKK